MQSKATTVDQYIQELPDDRREAMQKLRAIILKNLPEGFSEEMDLQQKSGQKVKQHL